MTDRGQNERALAESLKNAQIPTRDQGGIALCRRYAQLLDAARGTVEEPGVYAALGPRYLAALTAIGLTAAGRNGKGGVQSVVPSATKLDELRARREQRGG